MMVGWFQFTPLQSGNCQLPPIVHIFLWLLANNKTLMHDNFTKCRRVEDRTCLFCSERESVMHLFFECIVSKHTWGVISQIFHIDIGNDFESFAR